MSYLSLKAMKNDKMRFDMKYMSLANVILGLRSHTLIRTFVESIYLEKFNVGDSTYKIFSL